MIWIVLILLQLLNILFLLIYEIYKIQLHRHAKINALCCYEFIKSMGPNISAVSVVAIFIPMDKVPTWMLVAVFICGIIITKLADRAIEKIKE